MKKILYMLPFVLLAVACQEDTLDVYHGDNYVHFTPGINDKPAAEYNFAYDGITTAETEALVPVEIRIWGYLPETDFKCHVSIDTEKSTAEASDYELEESTLFRTGNHVDTLWIKVKRNAQLLKTDYKLVVNMTSAENAYVVGPAKYKSVEINVVDKIETKPLWWSTTQLLGDYSDLKFRLFNIYSGKFVTSIDNYSQIEFKQVAEDFKTWLKGEWEKGNRYYADDKTTPLYDTIP